MGQQSPPGTQTVGSQEGGFFTVIHTLNFGANVHHDWVCYTCYGRRVDFFKYGMTFFKNHQNSDNEI